MSGKKRQTTTIMSPEKQRIAIAKACGWQDATWAGDHEEVWELAGASFTPNRTTSQLPDYLHDLNAMAEAEKLFIPTHLEYSNNEGNWVEYAGHLSHITKADDHELSIFCFRMIHASASQRAEAFLKTLNLWTDD